MQKIKARKSKLFWTSILVPTALVGAIAVATPTAVTLTSSAKGVSQTQSATTVTKPSSNTTSTTNSNNQTPPASSNPSSETNQNTSSNSKPTQNPTPPASQTPNQAAKPKPENPVVQTPKPEQKPQTPQVNTPTTEVKPPVVEKPAVEPTPTPQPVVSQKPTVTPPPVAKPVVPPTTENVVAKPQVSNRPYIQSLDDPAPTLNNLPFTIQGINSPLPPNAIQATSFPDQIHIGVAQPQGSTSQNPIIEVKVYGSRGIDPVGSNLQGLTKHFYLVNNDLGRTLDLGTTIRDTVTFTNVQWQRLPGWKLRVVLRRNGAAAQLDFVGYGNNSIQSQL